MENRTVYIISGPTAVGKSLISYYLAKKIGGEIVNCDSIQLYKYMDIGSAKPTDREMDVVKHHLYSIVEPDESMTVARYRELAIDTINEILLRGRTPIVVGGTGLYLNSILYDMSFANSEADEKRRAELEAMAEEHGNEYMHALLEAIDPDAASRIHPNNLRKIIRAIEAFEYGKGVRDLSSCPMNPNYDFKFYALNMDRKWLYDRINKRVTKLMNLGLVDEVKNLLDRGYDPELPSMKGIGYKEIIGYLNGEYDLIDAKELTMKNTRHYAKRQLTWLKRYDFVRWIEIQKGDTVGDIVDRIINDDGETNIRQQGSEDPQ